MSAMSTNVDIRRIWIVSVIDRRCPVVVQQGTFTITRIDLMKKMIVAALMLSSLSAYAKDVEIPRSVTGDKGRYYLVEMKRDGNIVKAVHKRVGVYDIGFTRTETNCKTMKMREMGYGEGSQSAIKGNPTKWFDLVEGSSKSDLANFVCKRK